MRHSLGSPVDQEHAIIDAETLLARWLPDGAIWYAHACCSAGCDTGTQYDRLLDAGTHAHDVCTAVGMLGAQTARLARELLSAPRPLRAFVGHVEPTFDWTLRQPETRQHLTRGLVGALYPGLFRREPVGLAFTAHYKLVSELYSQVVKARDSLDRGDQSQRPALFRLRLTALDFQSIVILGDPTVCLPPLHSQIPDDAA